LDLGDNLGQSDLSSLNLEIMMKGIKDQLDSIPDMELLEARQFIQMEIQNMMEAKAEKEKDEGVKFLEENKMKDGVQSTPSGLQYKVIQEGTGAKPAATDVVKVHYHGTLINGEVFDSSVDRGEPVSFPLNQVIPGWTEGLQLMSKGSKYMFYIPENLGYGSRSMGNIKPYSTLIFEVELLDINPAE
jgi:FKBP-type peptidyl-prolyl cis-trans isomerase